MLYSYKKYLKLYFLCILNETSRHNVKLSKYERDKHQVNSLIYGMRETKLAWSQIESGIFTVLIINLILLGEI